MLALQRGGELCQVPGAAGDENHVAPLGGADTGHLEAYPAGRPGDECGHGFNAKKES